MLAELSLDTTTFTQLAERARARIPAVSGRAWTDHNLHDPGITLIELYAYLLEQRSYWLNRVVPPLDRAMLALLGVTPARSQPARTVVSAIPRTPGMHAALTAGTELPSWDGTLTFTTDDTIAVVAHRPLELELRASVTGRRPRGVDLRNGRTIVVVPNDGSRAQIDILLRLEAPWTARAEPVTLLLELNSPVEPQWDPRSASAPPPMRLEFLTRGPAGIGPVARVDDGTGGLRRSGIVRLWVGQWLPEPDGTYLIRIRTDAATATVPVRLARITVNAVLARHRARGRYTLTTSWPKLPGRTIELRHPNGPPLSGSLRLRLREAAGAPWRHWREVDQLATQAPGARVFALDGRVIRFGDGRAGRQPVLADAGERIRLQYWAGGGESGNIPAGSVFEHPDFEVRNIVAAVGGTTDEALADARGRAMALQHLVERAVLEDDIERLAVATPGVAVGRAIAVLGLDESLCLDAPGVTTVYVVPSAPRNETPSDQVEPVRVPDPMPDSGTLAAVRARLERARLLGSELQVRPPRWRDVRLTVRLSSEAALGPEVDTSVRTALEQHLDPLVGDEGRGWPLGGPIDPSALLRQVQSRLPDSTRVDEVAVQAGTLPPESCRPVPIGRCHLPRLLGVTVVGVRTPETGGGLK